MFFVRCDCGSVFTVKADAPALRGEHGVRCPGCQKPTHLSAWTSLDPEIPIRDGVAVSFVPDNAKLTVTFDP